MFTIVPWIGKNLSNLFLSESLKLLKSSTGLEDSISLENNFLAHFSFWYPSKLSIFLLTSNSIENLLTSVFGLFIILLNLESAANLATTEVFGAFGATEALLSVGS